MSQSETTISSFDHIAPSNRLSRDSKLITGSMAYDKVYKYQMEDNKIKIKLQIKCKPWIL
jgi:hypothetical protein